MLDDDENWLRIALVGDGPLATDDGAQENWLRIAIESFGTASARAGAQGDTLVVLDATEPDHILNA